jgi:hypothetical protein
MMKRKIVAAVAAASLGMGLGAGAASAGGPPDGIRGSEKPAGVACMQYGLGGLQSLGAPPQVVRDPVEAAGCARAPSAGDRRAAVTVTQVLWGPGHLCRDR